MKLAKQNRYFLKSDCFKDVQSIETDQDKEIPEPPIQKSCPTDGKVIDLISPEHFTCCKMDVLTSLKNRKSRRLYSDESLTLEELSYLLWSVQGVKKIVRNGYATLRTVPSGGARHSFETYIAVFNVDSLDKGLYRYLPLEHKLLFIGKTENLEGKIKEACFNRDFASNCCVTFIWTTIPYRTEWRYNICSTKLIALDAGHVCENLYLAAESINAGTCAIASYDQEKMDSLLNVDGENEFTIYVAPVGKQ